MDPFFSILIPTFKINYLSETINSCLSQTYSSYEIIIVNDHSPYDIDSIVGQFDDDRIRYYVNENNFGSLNVVDNWNKCLSYAKGKYIICMGDDDMLNNNALEIYKNLIEKYPGLGLYHGRTEIIDEKSVVYDIQEQRPEYESSLSLLWHRWNCRFKQFIGDFCFDAKNLKDNGGFYYLPMAWGSDDISAVIGSINNLTLKSGVANTQKPVFKYRVSRFTISNSGSCRDKIAAIALEKKWYDNFLRSIPQFALLDEVDTLYLSILKDTIENHFRLKYKDLIIKDIQSSTQRCFYWFNRASEVNLSKMQVVDCFLNAIRAKMASN